VNEAHSAYLQRWSAAAIKLLIVAIFLAAVVMGPIVGCGLFLLDISRAKGSFPERNKEAVHVVAAVWRYRNSTGTWPRELSQATATSLPPG